MTSKGGNSDVSSLASRLLIDDLFSWSMSKSWDFEWMNIWACLSGGKEGSTGTYAPPAFNTLKIHTILPIPLLHMIDTKGVKPPLDS